MNTDMIKKLAEARETYEHHRQAANAMIEKVQNSPDYQFEKNQRDNAKIEMEILEEQIKAEALVGYEVNQNKKPGNGIEIKIFKVATILDPDRAREWCMTNFTPALNLDEKTFREAAIAGTIPVSLATVEEQPRAQIASDLSEFLPDPNICPTSGKPNAECECEVHRIPF